MRMIYLGKSHVLSTINRWKSVDDGENCLKCRQRKTSNVGGIRSYILDGRKWCALSPQLVDIVIRLAGKTTGHGPVPACSRCTESDS